MRLVAEFVIPPEVLPGGPVLMELPAVRLDLERIVPTQEAALPFVWVRGDDAETFIDRVRDETRVPTE